LFIPFPVDEKKELKKNLVKTILQNALGQPHEMVCASQTME
jgi:hypothetical protein